MFQYKSHYKLFDDITLILTLTIALNNDVFDLLSVYCQKRSFMSLKEKHPLIDSSNNSQWNHAEEIVSLRTTVYQFHHKHIQTFTNINIYKLC